jgi:hypothetical protein
MLVFMTSAEADNREFIAENVCFSWAREGFKPSPTIE